MDNLDIDDIISAVSRCLKNSKNGMSISEVLQAYFKQTGTYLPFRMLGFNSAEAFLSTISNLTMIDKSEGWFVKLMSNESEAKEILEDKKEIKKPLQLRSNYKPFSGRKPNLTNLFTPKSNLSGTKLSPTTASSFASPLNITTSQENRENFSWMPEPVRQTKTPDVSTKKNSIEPRFEESTVLKPKNYFSPPKMTDNSTVNRGFSIPNPHHKSPPSATAPAPKIKSSVNDRLKVFRQESNEPVRPSSVTPPIHDSVPPQPASFNHASSLDNSYKSPSTPAVAVSAVSDVKVPFTTQKKIVSANDRLNIFRQECNQDMHPVDAVPQKLSNLNNVSSVNDPYKSSLTTAPVVAAVSDIEIPLSAPKIIGCISDRLKLVNLMSSVRSSLSLPHFSITTKSQDPREQLEEFTKIVHLPKPKYKNTSVKENIYSQVSVGNYKFSNYPDDAATEIEAQIIAAKKALLELEEIYKEPVNLFVTSDKGLIMKRILWIIDEHPSGVFEHELPIFYRQQHNELLPKNWTQLFHIMQLKVEAGAGQSRIISRKDEEV